MRARVLAAVLMVAGMVAVSAQTPKAGPVYDVSFLAGPAGEEVPYTGTTTFVVDAKGVVTGTMAIVSPTNVKATLAGRIDKGEWVFEYPYEMTDQGCLGVLKGTAKVPADRKVISGAVVIGGDCAPDPLNGTFTFTLQAKK
jgi:hypothetical protein